MWIDQSPASPTVASIQSSSTDHSMFFMAPSKAKYALLNQEQASEEHLVILDTEHEKPCNNASHPKRLLSTPRLLYTALTILLIANIAQAILLIYTWSSKSAAPSSLLTEFAPQAPIPLPPHPTRMTREHPLTKSLRRRSTHDAQSPPPHLNMDALHVLQQHRSRHGLGRH